MDVAEPVRLSRHERPLGPNHDGGKSDDAAGCHRPGHPSEMSAAISGRRTRWNGELIRPDRGRSGQISTTAISAGTYQMKSVIEYKAHREHGRDRSEQSGRAR